MKWPNKHPRHFSSSSSRSSEASMCGQSHCYKHKKGKHHSSHSPRRIRGRPVVDNSSHSANSKSFLQSEAFTATFAAAVNTSAFRVWQFATTLLGSSFTFFGIRGCSRKRVGGNPLLLDLMPMQQEILLTKGICFLVHLGPNNRLQS